MGHHATAIAAVDAITTDLETNIAFGTHRTWKYGTPPALTAEDTPLLNVSIGETTWARIATGPVFEPRTPLGVRWILNGADHVEYGGLGDQAVIASLATIADAMLARLLPMSEGIPTLVGKYARVGGSQIQPIEAGLWVARIELELTE